MILQTSALSVGYKTPILQEVSLAVNAGELLTLIGPNGAGKSTLLKTIARQLEPLGGVVWLQGKDLRQLSGNEAARNLSVLLTTRLEPELMTCEDVVAAGRIPYTGRLGILSQQDWDAVADAMALVQVTDLRQRDFNQISDGQRQRVLLARAICQQPKVLILDEPTSYLDVRYKLELLELLRRLARERHLAVVMSLHELDLAQKCSDRVLCVAPGGIDRCGTPEEIFTGPYIAQLYGLTEGSYQALSGSLELQRPQGEPQVFVLGGGGFGVPVYRRLQRAGIPFAAGILPQNDLDYPVAKALASALVEVPAFEPIDEAAVEQALALLRQCPSMLCCLPAFGTLNHPCQRILDIAIQLSKQCTLPELLQNR